MIVQSSTVPRILQRAIANRATELTMLPAIAMEALKLARDPDCTVEQFANLVAKDMALASEILLLANSPIYRTRGSKVSSLRLAVVRLGLRQCRNLVLSCSASSLMKRMPVQHEWVRKVLWQHSYRTAMTCTYLNTKLRLGFEGEEITAGLLHDLGRMLLAIAAPEDAADADDLSFCDEDQQLSQERMILGADHCSFGAWFAKKQGLPDDLVAAIEHHHQPHDDHPFGKLISLVATADHMANHFQRFEEAGDYDITSNPGAHALADLGYPKLLCDDASICENVFSIVLGGDEEA
ncbi:HDOD domain-containing protein [Stieleria varia]|nr:HDOD domain-containing protein [Stieleria varia]